MGSDLPKALIPVAGKPILQRLLESVRASGVDDHPVVVVGFGQEQICHDFGDVCRPVVQAEQLGTGHAVSVCRDELADAENVLVLYGDHPFVSPETIQKLVALHHESGGVMSLMTTVVPSFDGWYKIFSLWGRVLRDLQGKIIGNRQVKDATEAEREIKELDPALYCFSGPWLWENIFRVDNKNAQGEFYLTDLVKLAVSQGHEVQSMQIDPRESIGINTPEEKDLAEEILAG